MTTHEARQTLIAKIETMAMLHGHWSGWIDTTGSRFITLPFTSYGDYDDSCMVERANVTWFMKQYGKRAGIHLYNGNYGFTCVIVDIEHISRKTIDDITDYIDVLQYYPCIDDELLSRMEYRAIRNVFNEDYRFNMARGYKAIAWNLVSRNIGNIAVVESGGNVYIDWDRLCKACVSSKADRDRMILFT